MLTTGIYSSPSNVAFHGGIPCVVAFHGIKTALKPCLINTHVIIDSFFCLLRFYPIFDTTNFVFTQFEPFRGCIKETFCLD